MEYRKMEYRKDKGHYIGLIYRNDKGQLHSIDGPAIKWADGYEAWYLNGKRHRIDGPAKIWGEGTEEWYLNGKRHRTKGPAIWTDGIEVWYLNGKRHRIDGPAKILASGYKEWWVNGTRLTNEQEELAKKIIKDPNWNEIPLYLNDPQLSVIIDVVIKGT